MRKIPRIILVISTVVLALAIIVGIIIQLLTPNGAVATTYEILTLIVSGSSVLLAIISQVTSYRERREFTRIIRDLHELDDASDADASRDRRISQKLDQLLGSKSPGPRHPRKAKKKR